MANLSEIEDGIAANEISAAQVFTRLQSRITQLEEQVKYFETLASDRLKELGRIEQTNATHKEHIQMLEDSRQAAVDKLNGLIMEVACKHPGESRYETAKRYIHERENRPSTPAQVADSKEGEPSVMKGTDRTTSGAIGQP